MAVMRMVGIVKGARLSQGKPNPKVRACVVLVGLQLTSIQRTESFRWMSQVG